MKKIISINAGSSSLKFQLFEAASEELLAKALIERIGLEDSTLMIELKNEKVAKDYAKQNSIKNHQEAVERLFE